MIELLFVIELIEEVYVRRITVSQIVAGQIVADLKNVYRRCMVIQNYIEQLKVYSYVERKIEKKLEMKVETKVGMKIEMKVGMKVGMKVEMNFDFFVCKTC